MSCFALFLFFLVENAIVWRYCGIQRNPFRRRLDDATVLHTQMIFVSYGLYASAWIRDLIVVEGIRQAQPDVVYSPSTQQMMQYQTVIFLLITIAFRIISIRSVSIQEMFYPTRKLLESRSPGIFCPHYLCTFFLFVTAFFFRPSTTAIRAILTYTILLGVSLSIQPYFDSIKDWIELKRLPNNKGV